MDDKTTSPIDEFEREVIRREREERELEALWRMTKTERVTLLLAGGMTRRQLATWRERRPSEIPSSSRIREAQDVALWRMTAAERIAAMEAGRLTHYQLFAWSQKRPYEVPLIDGELAWIVYRTAEWIEAVQRQPQNRRPLVCDNTGESVLGCRCGRCRAARTAATKRLHAIGVL